MYKFNIKGENSFPYLNCLAFVFYKHFPLQVLFRVKVPVHLKLTGPQFHSSSNEIFEVFPCSDGQLIFPWDFPQLGEVMPELNFQSQLWLALCSHCKTGSFASCFQDREQLCLALVLLNGSCEPGLSGETEILSGLKQKILCNIQTL